jgi:hypothetical protein
MLTKMPGVAGAKVEAQNTDIVVTFDPTITNAQAVIDGLTAGQEEVLADLASMCCTGQVPAQHVITRSQPVRLRQSKTAAVAQVRSQANRPARTSSPDGSDHANSKRVISSNSPSQRNPTCFKGS